MGRKAVPTELKIIKGNPGRRPLNKTEPKPKKMSSTPSPPEILGDAGKREWKLICGELIRLGLLSCLDTNALRIYCDACDQYEIDDGEVKSHYKNEGSYLVQYTNKGGGENLVPHPALKLKRDAAEIMLKIGSEFAFTPSSRTKLKAGAENGEEDPFVKFMNRRNKKEGAKNA